MQKLTKPLMAQIRMLIARNTEVDAEIMRDYLAGLADNCQLCDYPLLQGLRGDYADF